MQSLQLAWGLARDATRVVIQLLLASFGHGCQIDVAKRIRGGFSPRLACINSAAKAHLFAATKMCLAMPALANWLGLPEELSQRIRFLQLQERLRTALEKRSQPDVDVESSEVSVTFEFEWSAGSIIYRWEQDEYEWFEDDNAYGNSTFREADGTVYTVDWSPGAE